ncbi:MAG TPA: ABC transporter substrate-binding protein [Acidimicrobiales bacterium]|nr:ABC transporter substrate-binding protein [Acidimicrobiales bacterium]
MHHTKLLRTLAILFAATLVAASCGDDDDATEATDTTGTTSAEVAGDEETTTTAGAPEPTAGFDGETIKLGVLVPLTGLPSLIGSPLAAGQEAYWDHVNTELGGIAGEYPVEVVLEDTLYEVNTTVQKYNKIKGDVVMLAQVMGTPHNQALLPLLDDDDIVSAPAGQDSIFIREQHMLPVIEPYQVDVINAVDYYLRNGGSVEDTFCGVIENDVYGEAGREGLEFAADEFGFDIAQVSEFELGDADFTAQVTALKNAQCDFVMATALPSEFNGLITTADNLDFAPRWVGQSPSWVDEFAGTDLASYYQDHVWIVAVGYGADPEASDFARTLYRNRPDQAPDNYFLFAGYQAFAVHQVLERAVERGDLSREGIVDAMNSIEVLEFDDVIGDYTWGPPEDRDPPRVSSMFAVDPAAPFALAPLEINFTSDAAEAYEVPGGS